MFKLFIAAPTMEKLKEKLQEAADSINPKPEVIKEETTYDDFGYVEAAPSNAAPLPATPMVMSADADHDSRGVPWDARIHSETKNKRSDGSWRTRRGIKQDQVKKIEATLSRKTKAAPSNTDYPLVPPVPQQPAAPALQYPNAYEMPQQPAAPVIPLFQQPVALAPIVIPPVPAAPPVVQQPVAPKTYDIMPEPKGQKPAHTFESFRQNLVTTLAALVNAGKMDQEYIGQLCQFFKVNMIFEVARNEEDCRTMFEEFCKRGLITKVG